MAPRVQRGRNPCLRCHEPLPAFSGASIRCPHCDHINVYRVRLRTWTERPGVLWAERILKSSAILLTPAGFAWAAFWPPYGPAHVAFFVPPATACLLWLLGSRLRRRGSFGRTDVILRNVAAAFGVLLCLGGMATKDWIYFAFGAPCMVVALLAPRIALEIARRRRARVARALEGPA